jgi:hypothetical protein
MDTRKGVRFPLTSLDHSNSQIGTNTMAKTIKQQAEELLTQYGWTYDASRRSPAWIDPKNRSDQAIYLGSHGSIRHGKSRTDSHSFERPGTPTIERLKYFLRGVSESKPIPAREVIKVENPITELRRKCHAIVQTMTVEQLNAMIEYDLRHCS